VLAAPGRPLWVYLACAALCRLGGGTFASSMPNVNAFFPQRLKGWALGINAGGGNIGVPAVQLVGLVVMRSRVFGSRTPGWSGCSTSARSARSSFAYRSANTTQSCRQPLAEPGLFGSALRCSSARIGTIRSTAVSSAVGWPSSA
jgi:nitrate/nitrite transporter NarK